MSTTDLAPANLIKIQLALSVSSIMVFSRSCDACFLDWKNLVILCVDEDFDELIFSLVEVNQAILAWSF